MGHFFPSLSLFLSQPHLHCNNFWAFLGRRDSLWEGRRTEKKSFSIPEYILSGKKYTAGSACSRIKERKLFCGQTHFAFAHCLADQLHPFFLIATHTHTHTQRKLLFLSPKSLERSENRCGRLNITHSSVGVNRRCAL